MLRSFLESYGQIFSLSSADGCFYGLNVMRMVDALDEEESDIEYFPDTSKFLEIRSHVFRNDIELPAVFMIPQFSRVSRVFVTAEYLDAITATGLPGAAFEELQR